MRKLKQTLTVLLAATFAAGVAGQAGAQNLDLDEMAAALVLPIINGSYDCDQEGGLPLTPEQARDCGDSVIPGEGDAVTLNTITNGSSNSILLKIDMIDGGDGDSDGNWPSTSFECELTGRETTTFVFMNERVYVECSNGPFTDGDDAHNLALFAPENGIMFVAVADPQSGNVISQDLIFGDSIVVDIDEGQAYSFGAIPFQAGFGQNNGDKVYHFDGNEYAKFPAVLATNFIMPSNVSGRVEAELILFTLDGSVGTTRAPRAKLGGFAYNDDEEAVDFQYEFDCFSIVELEDVNPNIVNATPGLGTLSGHLELVAQPTATGNDAHDDQYGDGNDTRTRPVHGWIVQNISGNRAVLVPGDQPTGASSDSTDPADHRVLLDDGAGAAAWGRPLSQSTTAVVPFLGDWDATLDADVLN